MAEGLKVQRAGEDFDRRFTNWVRWCQRKGLYQGRVGSIEGAYRSPQHWDPPEPRPEAVDVVDAIVVNRAYTELARTAHTYAKAIQVIVFKPYMRPQGQAQLLGVHYTQLENLLKRAKIMLRNLLRSE